MPALRDFLPLLVEAFGADGDRRAELLREDRDAVFFEPPAVGGEFRVAEVALLVSVAAVAVSQDVRVEFGLKLPITRTAALTDFLQASLHRR